MCYPVAMKSGAASFGELLKRHRVASGVSQESLAERARISTSAIGALERGIRRAPYRETVALLCKALGLSAAEQAELEAAAERARVRQSQAAGETLPSHNLPTRLTSFVGRSVEIVELKDLLAAHRLVTVTGSGGVGKTRIAVETACQLLGDRFREARFVDLAPVQDGVFVASAIAAALDIALPEDREPLLWLASQLKTRDLLLIIDNCEHTIEFAAAAAGAILRKCPNVSVIATSRERLAIEGESVYRLPSLPVCAGDPATIEEARTYDAFCLFMERASSEHEFTATATSLRAAAEICRRLEGIPLALELAATRLPALGLDGLNERLKGHFLTTPGGRDLPQRQQTLLATIAWSYDLLSEQEQSLLRRLAVFRGGHTLEAAAAVCADQSVADATPELVSRLVDKSLLFPTGDAHRRFVMLESVREFAAGKLRELGEFDAAARAHAHWLATVADRAHDQLLKISHLQWLDQFVPELDNVRFALEWCLNSGADADVVVAAQVFGGLRTLWLRRFHYVECLGWSTSILARLDVASHPAVAARVMRAHVQSARGPAKFEAARRAIPIFEQIGDREGLVLLYATLASDYSRIEEVREAEEFIAKAFALADQANLEGTYCYVLLLEFRSQVNLRAGRLKESRADLADAGRLRQAMPDARDKHFFLLWEGLIEFTEGNVERSVALFEAALAERAPVTSSLNYARDALAAAYLLLGNIDAAERTARQSLEDLFDQSPPAVMLSLAAIAAIRGHPRIAARLWGFAQLAPPDAFIAGSIRRAHYEILRSSLHEQLPAECIEALVSEGKQFDRDRATQEARSIFA